MNTLNYLLALSITSSAFVGNHASAETTPDLNTNDLTVTKAMNSTVPVSANCVVPTNRDYHDVLASYTADTAHGYKFSGCGGVL